MLRLAATVLAGLAAAGAAWAAYPGLGTTQSVRSPNGKLLYDADAQHGRTTVSMLREASAERLHAVKLRGPYGFPLPTNDSAEGISHDGRTLVLSRIGAYGRFALLDARTLHVRRSIRLPGQFTYDALSPTARTLFLIEHVGRGGVDRYYVRAYDLVAGRLLKQIVFDTREKGERMTGYPISRATGPTGRWVYTLYGRSNGTLFVHALDTVDRHAVCIDLPRRVAQEAQQSLRLKLTAGRLAVLNGAKAIAAIDRKTLRITRR